MHPAAKIIIGLILVIIGLALFVDSVVPISGGPGMRIGGMHIDWLKNFFVVLTGVIPIFLILVGLFVVWLESDELKARKELSRQEAKKEPPKEETKEKKK